MADLAQTNQLIFEKIDESDVDLEEFQVIDAPKERKEDKLATRNATVSQTDVMETEKPIVTIGLSVQDILEGEP